MKLKAFSVRVSKEIVRDPLTLGFGLGFPVVLLLLLSAIQAKIPVDLFAIDRLAPGITVFGLTFISLFSATLIAKDRESAFLQRLYATPMKATDFILGYTLPFIPISVAQSAICYLLAICLGLKPTVNILLALLSVIPLSLLFIGFGLMCGSIFSVKQVGGICGALFTNLTAWLSGIWFDLSLIGGIFERIAKILPFYHAVNFEQGIISGGLGNFLVDLAIIAAYTLIILALAVFFFLRQMKNR